MLKVHLVQLTENISLKIHQNILIWTLYLGTQYENRNCIVDPVSGSCWLYPALCHSDGSWCRCEQQCLGKAMCSANVLSFLPACIFLMCRDRWFWWNLSWKALVQGAEWEVLLHHFSGDNFHRLHWQDLNFWRKHSKRAVLTIFTRDFAHFSKFGI